MLLKALNRHNPVATGPTFPSFSGSFLMQGLLSWEWEKGRPLFRCKRRQDVEGTVALTAATVNSTRSLGRRVAQVLYIREKHDGPASFSVVFPSGDPKIVPGGVRPWEEGWT